MDSSQRTADGRLVKAELVSDAALTGEQDDDLDHNAVAQVVSDLVRQVPAPTNVALFGPWGSGKSSIYGMVETRLRSEARHIAIVRYDAWKFGGHELQRNFLAHVADTLNISHDKYLSNLTSGVETTRLRLGRFLWSNRWSLLGALVIALMAGAIWLTISAEVALRSGSADRATEYIRALPSASIVFGAVIGGLLLSNQALASATEKRSRSSLQDADQFSTAFRDLIKTITADNWVKQILEKAILRRPVKNRLVVFIDELDRCSPNDVVATLTHIKTFLDNDSCVFVVAADRDVLESAIEEAPQAKPLRENEPYYSTAGAFIDKIFQHQISLPPVRPEALTSFAMALANKHGGLWQDLRSDQRIYEDVVYSLIPAHVQSPRRVKVLMNNFVTNARVMQARGLAWKERATEVAVLTVLQTEFPTVVKDLLRQPRLLEALCGDIESPSRELEELAASYRPFDAFGDPTERGADRENPHVNSPSGPIYAEPDTSDERKDSARQRLNAFLDAYLGKIHAAGISLPSLELIYLQRAAHVEGLEDAGLARLLDFAADTDPSVLASAFSDATTRDKQAAIRVLIARANSNVLGPSRANLVEAACRIVEDFDDLADVEAVAGQAASTVLAEARKARWRSEATPGALILGLLDPNISHPIAALGDEASAAQLGREGFFDRLLPLLSHLNDARAEEIEDLLGVAYSDYPEALHTAFRVLTDHAATRLWGSQEDRIHATITALLGEVPEPPSAPAGRVVAPSAHQRSPEPEEPNESSMARYAELLDQIAQRNEPSSGLGSRALLLGIRSEEEGLYDIAWERRESLLESVVIDKHARNEVAIDAVSRCPDEHLDGWLTYVDVDDSTITSDEVSQCVDRLLQDLRKRPPENLASLPSQFQLIAAWSSDELVAEIVEKIIEVLASTPFDSADDPGGLRRTTSYALLRLLEGRLTPERIHSIRAADVEAAARTEPLTMNAVAQMCRQIYELDKARATTLDEALSKQKAGDKSAGLARTRLRISARVTGQRDVLNVNTFGALLSDDEQSAALLSEWFETRPPLSQVEKAIKASSVGQRAISQYAATRKIADRSGLWIALFNAHYSREHLRAVGCHGVNRTVVALLGPKITHADLNTQKAVVETLLTADLSSDSGARTGATKLAIELLRSGVIGAGPHAAQIVMNANGAGSGQKPELRKAFDAYTSANPTKLSKTVIRRLDDMGLLTKKKSNPVAQMLGWLFSDKN